MKKSGGKIMETIKIKYHADIDKIAKIEVGDWIDLRASEDVFIPYMCYEPIPLGVSMKLPDGYEAHVVPRSSTFKKWGIIQANSFGVIDNSYSGTNDIWHFPAICLSVRNTKPLMDKENEYQIGTVKGTWIHKNDRICQFRIVKKQPEIEFEEVNELDAKDRGGFGSTGSI